MRFPFSLPIITLICMLGISGCTLVKSESGSEGVRVIDEAASAGCKVLGSTRVEVLDKIGFLSRKPSKISDELDTLARNAAVDLGGNAVAPSGPIESGNRVYRVLRCP